MGKSGSNFLPRAPGALGVLLALVELFQEEQVRKLFDGVQRIGEAAGPELVPERFDLGAELRIGEQELLRPTNGCRCCACAADSRRRCS